MGMCDYTNFDGYRFLDFKTTIPYMLIDIIADNATEHTTQDVYDWGNKYIGLHSKNKILSKRQCKHLIKKCVEQFLPKGKWPELNYNTYREKIKSQTDNTITRTAAEYTKYFISANKRDIITVYKHGNDTYSIIHECAHAYNTNYIKPRNKFLNFLLTLSKGIVYLRQRKVKK